VTTESLRGLANICFSVSERAERGIRSYRTGTGRIYVFPYWEMDICYIIQNKIS
jgi:hypothetical protein